MSLPQKQKDTIREEFRAKQLELDTKGGFLEDVGDDYDAVDFDMDVMEDWVIEKLDQAYQQGAKDKVEEVRGDIKQIFFNDGCFYSDIHKKMLLSLESLKDNT